MPIQEQVYQSHYLIGLLQTIFDALIRSKPKNNSKRIFTTFVISNALWTIQNAKPDDISTPNQPLTSTLQQQCLSIKKMDKTNMQEKAKKILLLKVFLFF